MSIIYCCTVYLASFPHFHCGHLVIGAVPLYLKSDNILINSSCSYTINQFGSETVCNTFQPIVYNVTHLAQNGFRWQYAIPFLQGRTSCNLPIDICIEHLCTPHIGGASRACSSGDQRGVCCWNVYDIYKRQLI